MKFRREIFCAFLGAILILPLFGCGKKEPVARLNIAGSSTIQPALAECARLCESGNFGAKINVEGGGSLTGIATVMSGTADLGALSRALNEEEEQFDLVPTIIAYDGLAMVVNADNPIADLTETMVRGIFLGQIVNWSEIGGPDLRIVPIRKEKSHGTQKVFEEHFQLGKMMKADMLTIGPNSQAMLEIARDSGAIAFVSIGAIDRAEATGARIKRVSLGGVMPTKESVKDKTYPLTRPLLLITKGNPEPLEQKFIDFVLSPPGQAVFEREDFIRVGSAELK